MRKVIILLFLGAALILPVFGQSRSFDQLFPGLGENQKRRVFSPEGLIVSSDNGTEPRLVHSSAVDIDDIAGPILSRDFSCVVESLLVIPYQDHPVDLLNIYNALGKIRNLKGRLYHSSTRNENIPLFEDATRIKGAKSTSPVPDPSDVFTLPDTETVYLRLRDINFGNSFYRAELTAEKTGLRYHLSNFRSLTYLFIPVIKEDNFVTQMYFEPIAEGVLVYSIAGADVSDFIASRIDIPSAIRKRLEVILDWVIDGITLF
jgi:hypothetical protein